MAAANSDMRVVIAGAGGRMGRTLISAIAATKGMVLAGAVDAAGSAVIGRDAGELAGLGANGIKVTSDAAALLKNADGLIDFTIPAATLAFAELTAAAGLVHVIGTTGHSAEEEAVIAKAASRATIVKSGNMSLGVNLLAGLVKQVAKTLNDDYDIEIFEMHHNKKIDAPSGTALMLGRAAAAGRGVDLDDAFGARPRRHDRRAQAGRYRLCLAARRHHCGRAQGDFRRPAETHRAHAPGRGPPDLRARRAARGAVGATAKSPGSIRWPTCLDLEHDPEKWNPVFRQDHAPTKILDHDPINRNG